MAMKPGGNLGLNGPSEALQPMAESVPATDVEPKPTPSMGGPSLSGNMRQSTKASKALTILELMALPRIFLLYIGHVSHP